MNIESIVDRSYYWIDANAKRTSLMLARKICRRSFLSRLGMMLAGATAFPLLPVSRSFAQNSIQEVGDPQSCEYWRYCAMSGTLVLVAEVRIPLARQALKHHQSHGLAHAEIQ